MSRDNLHRLAGGLACREREVIEAGCCFCGSETTGLIRAWDGPKAVCAVHAEQGKRLGYTIHPVTPAGDPR